LIAVTSFNPDKQPYGVRCLEGLAKFFPGRVVAYLEGPISKEGWGAPVEVKDFWAIPGIKEYLEKIKRVAGSDGTGGQQKYDYRFDTSKFCRKVFAQDQAFDLGEQVFWFDADCVVFRPLPGTLLSSLVHNVPFAYLGRKTYTETGWLGFNTKHEKFKDFRAKYLNCFLSGRIFQMPEWHDCYAFDYARQGIKGNDLTPGAKGTEHVLLKSVLANYMDHTKGPKRKALGYSPGHPKHDGSGYSPVLGDDQ
jgi:hypothetical protein